MFCNDNLRTLMETCELKRDVHMHKPENINEPKLFCLSVWTKMAPVFGKTNVSINSYAMSLYV